jgi:hypothetical protein
VSALSDYQLSGCVVIGTILMGQRHALDTAALVPLLLLFDLCNSCSILCIDCYMLQASHPTSSA